MNQASLDFSLPVNGRTPRAKHASSSGARRAAQDRPSLTLAYIALLKACGPLSDYQAAKALGRMVSSINSTRNGLGDLIEESGKYEVSEFGTKRQKYQVKGK